MQFVDCLYKYAVVVVVAAAFIVFFYSFVSILGKLTGVHKALSHRCQNHGYRQRCTESDDIVHINNSRRCAYTHSLNKWGLHYTARNNMCIYIFCVSSSSFSFLASIISARDYSEYILPMRCKFVFTCIW